MPLNFLKLFSSRVSARESQRGHPQFPESSEEPTTSYDEQSVPAGIFQPAVLPCGRTVQNRLVKAAMYEHLASFPGGPPNVHHFRLYSEWAKHGWGMIVTGNVQVAADHLTLGRDIVVPSSCSTEERLEQFQILANSIHGLYPYPHQREPNGTLAIMQLNHAGRQSSNFIGGRPLLQPPLAPSAIRVGSGSNTGLVSSIVNALLFQTPKAMSEADILETIENFVLAAVFAHKAGFDGVQLHVAHGYLLAQFLSPKVNKRKDAYSSDYALEMIRTIVNYIRTSTAEDFIISIKLNAADYSASGSTIDSPLTEGEQLALKHLLAMASWGSIDIIEISGGDYEKPDFMTSENDASKSPRQAFFARFSHRALQALDSLRELTPVPAGPTAPPLILLTGGLRTPGLLRSSLASRHADLLGVGRGSVLCPDLPSLLRQKMYSTEDDNVPFQPEPDLRKPLILEYPPFSWVWRCVPKVKLIGAGVEMAWFIVAMRHIADSACSNTGEVVRPDYSIGGFEAVFWMWVWAPSLSQRSRVLASRTFSFIVVTLVAITAYFFDMLSALKASRTFSFIVVALVAIAAYFFDLLNALKAFRHSLGYH